MKIFSRLFPFTALLMFCLSVFVFSCQKTEVAPINQQDLTEQSPQFKLNADGASADCKLFFKELSEDEAENLEKIDLSEVLGKININGTETAASVAGDYCNYVIVEVKDKGTGDCGPKTMDGFCVSCPSGSCAFDGILWSPNGYRARAIRFQPVAGSSCTACNEGVVYPRG